MSSVSGRDRAVSGRGSQPDRETSKDDLMPICIPIRSSFRDSTADEHTRDESRTREEPSIRLLAGVLLSNVATGLADVLIADDRPAVGNHLSDKGKRPPANAVKRQVSMLKGAMESWTGIARLTMSKILKAVFLTAFVFIGIAVFLRGERDYFCVDADGRNHTNDMTTDEHECGWTLVDALYFSVVTVSTVGYGDLRPSDPGMKAFTVCFILVGIVAIFPKISSVVTTLTTPISGAGRRILDKLFPAPGIDFNGDGIKDFRPPRHPLVYYPKNLFPSMFLWWLTQFVSAAVFVRIEPEGTYWLWLYHCLVTATTVGYGDVRISTQWGRGWAVCHIVFSVCGLADILQTYGTLQRERRSDVAQMRQLNRQLDPNLMDMLIGHARRLLPQMPRDGEGLYELEFVLAMLIELDVVSLKQVQPFLRQFHAMDVDGDGRVGRKDIEMLQASEMAEKAGIPPAILSRKGSVKRIIVAGDSQREGGRTLEATMEGAEGEEECSGDAKRAGQAGSSGEGGGGEEGVGSSGGGGAEGGQLAERGSPLPDNGQDTEVEVEESSVQGPAAVKRRHPSYPPAFEALMTRKEH